MCVCVCMRVCVSVHHHHRLLSRFVAKFLEIYLNKFKTDYRIIDICRSYYYDSMMRQIMKSFIRFSVCKNFNILTSKVTKFIWL